MTLIAKNIFCRRNNRLLFSDINFSIAPGEWVQIAGNNGVGKSSLLRIVAGLLAPESGHIFWHNQLISQSDFYQHLFYVGHSLAIKSELTVAENILYYTQKINCANEKIKNVLRTWSLDHLSEQLCGTLSQGQRQRVALARLLLLTATIWILDEPFSNLDESGVLLCEQLLLSHLNNGGIILLSTHREIKLDVMGNKIVL